MEASAREYLACSGVMVTPRPTGPDAVHRREGCDLVSGAAEMESVLTLAPMRPEHLRRIRPTHAEG